jgi:hypothetical protein
LGTETEVIEKDPWNSWVFRLGARGYFNGEETNKSSNLDFNISDKRVTQKNKFSLRASFGENKSTFTFDENDIVAINNNKSLNVSNILSIKSHWSFGFFGDTGASTYSNYKLFWRFRPAIEYNFFTYE